MTLGNRAPAVPDQLTKTMLAARIYAQQTPVRIDEVPVPDLGDEDVLVQTAACALSASAVRIVSPRARGMGRRADRVYPYVVTGHPAGRVAKTGPGARGFRPGDRVILVAQPECKTCVNCRSDRGHICVRKFRPQGEGGSASAASSSQGTISQYVKAHFRDLVLVPEGMSFALACHVGPLSSPYRAVKRSGLKPGESIIVSGATGTYGFRGVLVSLASGAGLVIALGRNPHRLQYIKQIAPQRIETLVTSEGPIEQRVRDFTDGWGAHRLVDFLPDAVEITSAAVRSLRPGGRAVLMGEGGNLDLSYSFVQSYAIELTGSSGAAFHDYPEVLELLNRDILSLYGVELRAFPVEQVNEAIGLMAERPGKRPLWCYIAFSLAFDL